MQTTHEDTFFVKCTVDSSAVPLQTVHYQLPYVVSFSNNSFYFPSQSGTHTSSIYKFSPTDSKSQLFFNLPENSQVFYLKHGYLIHSAYDVLHIFNAETKRTLYVRNVNEILNRRQTMNNQAIVHKTPLGDTICVLARNSKEFEVIQLCGEKATTSEKPVESGSSCVNNVAISKDGWWLAACNSDGSCYLHKFNEKTKSYHETVHKFDGGSYGAAINCNGTLLATFGPSSSSIRIYNLKTKQELQMTTALTFHRHNYPTLQFSPDDPLLLCCAEENVNMILVDKDLTQATPYLVKNSASEKRCCFSDDGRYLCLVSKEGAMILELHPQFYKHKGLFTKEKHLFQANTFQDVKVLT